MIDHQCNRLLALDFHTHNRINQMNICAASYKLSLPYIHIRKFDCPIFYWNHNQDVAVDYYHHIHIRMSQCTTSFSFHNHLLVGLMVYMGRRICSRVLD